MLYLLKEFLVFFGSVETRLKSNTPDADEPSSCTNYISLYILGYPAATLVRATNLASKYHMTISQAVQGACTYDLLWSPIMYLGLTVYPWLYASSTSLQGITI